jgi:membrane-bound lytic murein transglycosylase
MANSALPVSVPLRRHVVLSVSDDTRDVNANRHSRTTMRTPANSLEQDSPLQSKSDFDPNIAFSPDNNNSTGVRMYTTYEVLYSYEKRRMPEVTTDTSVKEADDFMDYDDQPLIPLFPV